ncbi:MAG: hypothetical protein F4X98_11755 [Gammaproteobacteria bacterium]|nr:hypothetical protein [Gammaproteobacteria bacterium]
MSRCARLAELLTAEPDELAARTGSDLARHIRECPHCTTAARAMLAANDGFREVLEFPGRVDVDAVLRKAHTATTRSRPGRRAWFTVPAPARVVAATSLVAAFAVAVALKMHNQADKPLPNKQWTPLAEEQPVLVDAPGYNVAVIPTTNPDITIFWFFKENDDEQDVDLRGGPPAVGTDDAG